MSDFLFHFLYNSHKFNTVAMSTDNREHVGVCSNSIHQEKERERRGAGLLILI